MTWTEQSSASGDWNENIANWEELTPNTWGANTQTWANLDSDYIWVPTTDPWTETSSATGAWSEV